MTRKKIIKRFDSSHRSERLGFNFTDGGPGLTALCPATATKRRKLQSRKTAENCGSRKNAEKSKAKKRRKLEVAKTPKNLKPKNAEELRSHKSNEKKSKSQKRRKIQSHKTSARITEE
jgi:hypothetical protein